MCSFPTSDLRPGDELADVVFRVSTKRIVSECSRVALDNFAHGDLQPAHLGLIPAPMATWACLPPVAEEHSARVRVIKPAQGGTVFAVSDTSPFAEAEQRQAMGPRRASISEALSSQTLGRMRPFVAWTTDRTSNTVP
jgi:hypothetical protein